MKELWGQYRELPWELLDTEDENNSIEELLSEYSMAYGEGWRFEIR